MNFDDYRPAAGVLERLRQVDFLAVIGPSAVGKDAVMAAASTVHPGLSKVLSTVSRPPRPGEQQEIDYHFRSKNEMQAMLQRSEYVQITSTPLGDLYATHAADYPIEGVGMMAVLAHAIPSFRKLPFKRFRTVYILPPSWEAWQQRMQSHNFTRDQRQGRLIEATRSLKFALTDPSLYFIANTVIDVAAAHFVAWVDDRSALPIATDRTQAQQLASELLDRVQDELHRVAG